MCIDEQGLHKAYRVMDSHQRRLRQGAKMAGQYLNHGWLTVITVNEVLHAQTLGVRSEAGMAAREAATEGSVNLRYYGKWTSAEEGCQGSGIKRRGIEVQSKIRYTRKVWTVK